MVVFIQETDTIKKDVKINLNLPDKSLLNSLKSQLTKLAISNNNQKIETFWEKLQEDEVNLITKKDIATFDRATNTIQIKQWFQNPG